MSHHIEQRAFQRSKEREALIRRYEQLCECGHKQGRHWYAVENGTMSHDCRDCDCLNFILQKVRGNYERRSKNSGG